MKTIQRDIVGAFIFSNDNKLLVGKGRVYQDYWIIPGGGIEKNETKIEALKRETKEETGIDIQTAKIEEIEGVLTGQSEKVLKETGEKVIVNMNFYNFKIILPQDSGSIKPVTEDDFSDAQWFDAKDLKNLKLSPPTVTTLTKMGLL